MHSRPRRRLALIASLAALALAAGLAAPPAQAACDNENISIKKENLAKARAALRCLVNEERARRDIKKLTNNDKLARAAQKHADDMERRDFFDHANPDGEEFTDRIRDEGYRFIAAAENIAQGQSTPKKAMETWMKSKGHKANILGRDYADIGVGITKNRTFVQVFADR